MLSEALLQISKKVGQPGSKPRQQIEHLEAVVARMDGGDVLLHYSHPVLDCYSSYPFPSPLIQVLFLKPLPLLLVLLLHMTYTARILISWSLYIFTAFTLLALGYVARLLGSRSS